MIVEEGKNSINLAVDFLQRGEIVAIPTETVYGLAADATNSSAIEKIYKAKNRPLYNPLIAHVADITMAQKYCNIDNLSMYLMKEFWPGALSLVLPLYRDSKINDKALAGLSTVALRCPQGIFNDIINAFKLPLVAPSANISGSISTTNAAAVAQNLKEKVSLIIDGGACPIGVESTIIKVHEKKLFILRPGGISYEILRLALDKFIDFDVEIVDIASDKIEAPGMLSSHYAPNAFVRLNATEIYEGEALLAFGQQDCKNVKKAVFSLNLSISSNLEEAAHNLFNFLHLLDKKNVKTIAVQPIPNKGLGVAINDRLTRAAFRK